MKKNNYDCLNYFELLEVAPDCSEEVIRQKYRELAKKWHPDYNTSPDAVDVFKKLSVAYDVLKDEKSKLKYILLSTIYNKNNFPDMNSLCVIKNMKGEEDVNVRSFRLIEVTGKLYYHNVIDKVYCCSANEAGFVINNITKHNWIHGFLSITSFFTNIKALISNRFSLKNKKENLKLLVHNAIAFESEGKFNEALTSAYIAREYANDDCLVYLNKYIELLKDNSLLPIKKWNFNSLKKYHIIYPVIFILIICCISALFILVTIDKQNKSRINLKQVVTFKDGQQMFSDVSVAKFFDIPVDVYDKNRLYHFAENTNTYHGADEKFDIFKNIEKDTTVRITGYTADNKWARVMFDNGEMAFVKTDKLKKGIGKDIPLWSKIFKEN